MTLRKDPVAAFDCLTVTTDVKTLTIEFRSTNPAIVSDRVTVDLKRGVVVN